MIAHSSEDVGLANSNALIMTVAAMTAYERIGMPEGALPLAHAIIYICVSPKSNSVVTAMNAAQSVCKTCPILMCRRICEIIIILPWIDASLTSIRTITAVM